MDKFERLRALEKKWRGIGDAKHSKAEGPFAVESSKIANLCEGDLCHQMADELATLIAELGQEVGAVAPVSFAVELADGTLGALGWIDYAKFERVKNMGTLANGARYVFAYRTSPAHTSEARDAARYRWLRDQNSITESPDAWTITRCDFADIEDPARYWVGTDLDAAIDAAMRQEGGSDA